MLRLITDFDGPIMDVSERYYRVYQYCLETIQRPQQEIRELSKGEFWQLKRARVPEREIGEISGLDSKQAKEFAKLRRNTVHTLPYLKYDRPIPGAIDTLEELQQQGIDLVIMTMRRVRELESAFEQYDLRKYFASDRCYCLSDDYPKTNDVQDKSRLMAKAIQELTEASDTWMVGDTEADIVAAKTQDIKVIAVLSGIRDRERLEQYQPDFIADNLAEAVKIFASAIEVRV